MDTREQAATTVWLNPAFLEGFAGRVSTVVVLALNDLRVVRVVFEDPVDVRPIRLADEVRSSKSLDYVGPVGEVWVFFQPDPNLGSPAFGHPGLR